MPSPIQAHSLYYTHSPHVIEQEAMSIANLITELPPTHQTRSTHARGRKRRQYVPHPIHPLQQPKRTHSNRSTYTKLTHHHHSPPRPLRRRHRNPNIHLPIRLEKALRTPPHLPLPNLAHPAKTLQNRHRRSRHRGRDVSRLGGARTRAAGQRCGGVGGCR